MTYYKPCKNCAVDKSTCEIRQAVQTAIAGLHVKSLNFSCKHRRSMFEPGQRVTFTWTHWELSEYGDADPNKMTFTGTVLQESGTKFIVRVDDADGQAFSPNDDPMPATHVFKSDRLIIKVRPSDMTSADEPARVMCPDCAAYQDEPSRCLGYGDPNSWDSYWPSGCLHKPEAPK